MRRNWILATLVVAMFASETAGDINRRAIPTKCPRHDSNHRSVMLPHESDCTKFYKCDHGRPILSQCPVMDKEGNRLHFNPELQVCDWPLHAGCARGPHPTTVGKPTPGMWPTWTNIVTGTSKVSTDAPGSSAEETSPTPSDGPNRRLPHEYNCSLYYELVNGEKITRECPRGLHFSPSQRFCRKPQYAGCEAGTPTDPTCGIPCGDVPDGWLIPHECLCTLYYRCRNGDFIRQECSNGLHFNAKRFSCDYPDVAGCETLPAITEATTAKPTTSVMPSQCPPDNSGGTIRFPHPTNCSLFYKCDNGKKQLLQCPKGLDFNPVIQMCDWPDSAGCTATSEPAGTSEDETQPTVPSVGTSTKVSTAESTVGTPTSELPNDCPTEDTGSVVQLPHPDNCSLYYVCEDGQKVLWACPPGLEFSPDLHTCDWPEVSGCLASATISMATPTTETTPEPTTGSEPEATPKPTTGSEPEATPKPTTGSEPEATPKPTTGSEPEATPKPTTGSQPEATPKPTTGSQPEATPKPTTGSEPEATPKPTTGSEPAATPKPTTGSEPEATPKPTTGSEPAATPKPTTGSEPEATPKPTTGSEPEATPKPTTGSEPEVTPKPTTGSEPEATPKPTTGSEPEATPKPTTGSEPEATPQPTTGSETEATPQPTTGSETDATPQPTTGSVTEATPQPTTGSATEATPQPTTGSETEATPQPTTGRQTEATPQPTTGSETEATRQPTTESATDATPQPTTEATPNPTTKVSTTVSTVGTPAGELPNDCPTEDTGTVVQLPHPYNCSLYYVCENGRKVLQACPDGLEFSPDSHVCGWPEVSGCLASTTARTEMPTSEATPKATTGSETEATPQPTTGRQTEATPQPTTGSVTEATSQPTTESATEATPQPTTGRQTEATPQPTTGRQTEATPQPTTGSETEATRQPTTESATDATPQPTTDATPNPTTKVSTTVSTAGTPAGELPNDCPTEDTGTVVQLPHPYNCSLYYVCENGRKVLQACPDGLEFSPDSHVCGWPEVSGCLASTTARTEMPTTEATPKATTGSETEAPPESTPEATPKPTTEATSRPMTETTVNAVETECPPDNSGMAVHMPHPTNCSLYYKCDNGVKVLQTCPAGLEFNAAKQVCDWPDAAGCVASTTELPSTPISTVTPSVAPETTVTSTQPTSSEVPVTSPQTPRPETTTAAVECPTDADGRLTPHETDCSLYYECAGGQKILQECTPGLHFSPDLEMCVWPANAGCETTTVSSPASSIVAEVTSQTTPIPGDGEIATGVGCIGTCPAQDPEDYTVLLRHEDCTKFCKCSNSVAYEYDCPAGLHFSPVSFVCDFPENAQCQVDNGQPEPDEQTVREY